MLSSALYLVLILGIALTANVPLQVATQEEFKIPPADLETSPGLLTYSDPTAGIKIQYPSIWVASSNALENFDDLVAFYSPLENITDPFNAKVTISAIPFLQNISLNEYTNLTLTSFNQSEDSILLENASDVLSGYPAHKAIYALSSVPAFVTMEAWTVIGNKLYLVTYRAEPLEFDFYFPAVEQMLDSFEVMKAPG